MSLQTDIIFVKAIQSDATLLGMLPAGDVYNTTIALPDEDLDNAQVPYVIVSYNGLNNDPSTKDDYEGDTDTVTIGIQVTGRTRPELGAIAKRIRKAIRRFFTSLEETDECREMIPYDYQFSASQVSYDPLKPCYWQTLTYQCDVMNDTEDEEDDDEG